MNRILCTITLTILIAILASAVPVQQQVRAKNFAVQKLTQSQQWCQSFFDMSADYQMAMKRSEYQKQIDANIAAHVRQQGSANAEVD